MNKAIKRRSFFKSFTTIAIATTLVPIVVAEAMCRTIEPEWIKLSGGLSYRYVGDIVWNNDSHTYGTQKMQIRFNSETMLNAFNSLKNP